MCVCLQALGASELKSGAEEVAGRLRRRSVQVRRGAAVQLWAMGG